MAETDSQLAPDRSAQFRVLVVAILGAGIVFLDSSVANVALPAIQRDLGISTAQQQWAASAYLLTLSVLLLPGGRLADLFGRRRMFLSGLIAYAVLAVSAALAQSGAWLIAARALQGVAGAVLVPTTLALINATYAPSERGQAIGTWAGWSGISTILGPVLGGLIIDRLSWHYAFLLSPAIAVVTFFLAWRIAESRDELAERTIDWIGIGLLILSLGGVVFALIQGPIAGWNSMLVMLAGIGGALLLPVFVWREARARSPMLPLGMFSNRNLSAANVVTLFVYAGLYGMFFYVGLYVQSSLEQSAAVAGALFVPITLSLFFLSPVAGRLNDRYGPRWLMCFGPLGAAAGLMIVSFTTPGHIWTVMVPGLVVFGVGLGFTVAPVTTTAIGSAERRYSGVASGFNNAVARVAGLFAIALMGIIVINLWHAGIAGVSRQASEEVQIRLESVSQKAFVIPNTTGMAADQAAEVQDLATAAAVSSFRSGMWLAALLVAIGGLVSAVAVRTPPPAPEQERQ